MSTTIFATNLLIVPTAFAAGLIVGVAIALKEKISKEENIDMEIYGRSL